MPNLDYIFSKDTGTRMNADAADLWFDNYQPDGTGNGACGAMFFNGRLINTDCDTKSFFICEHELDNIRSPASTSSADSEQFLQPYVGGGIDK
ncbi:hypothetical protein PYW07_003800 [Mythimna separata]|uniref:C-type lectin domain-containing protein n=1 Tax=Mythimna separata TaxID=271217 RepID=A0AAD7YQA2_MYTSE|nr:hypothetical protein PYW07_003800 [Mythimna separata]